MSKAGDDCYFYLFSSCSKGDKCSFRHCHTAKQCETICLDWENGSCTSAACGLRHYKSSAPKTATSGKAPASAKAGSGACYWETQSSGYTKAACAFKHTKPRKLPVSFPTVPAQSQSQSQSQQQQQQQQQQLLLMQQQQQQQQQLRRETTLPPRLHPPALYGLTDSAVTMKPSAAVSLAATAPSIPPAIVFGQLLPNSSSVAHPQSGLRLRMGTNNTGGSNMVMPPQLGQTQQQQQQPGSFHHLQSWQTQAQPLQQQQQQQQQQTWPFSLHAKPPPPQQPSLPSPVMSPPSRGLMSGAALHGSGGLGDGLLPTPVNTTIAAAYALKPQLVDKVAIEARLGNKLASHPVSVAATAEMSSTDPSRDSLVAAAVVAAQAAKASNEKRQQQQQTLQQQQLNYQLTKQPSWQATSSVSVSPALPPRPATVSRPEPPRPTPPVSTSFAAVDTSSPVNIDGLKRHVELRPAKRHKEGLVSARAILLSKIAGKTPATAVAEAQCSGWEGAGVDEGAAPPLRVPKSLAGRIRKGGLAAASGPVVADTQASPGRETARAADVLSRISTSSTKLAVSDSAGAGPCMSADARVCTSTDHVDSIGEHTRIGVGSEDVMSRLDRRSNLSVRPKTATPSTRAHSSVLAVSSQSPSAVAATPAASTIVGVGGDSNSGGGGGSRKRPTDDSDHTPTPVPAARRNSIGAAAAPSSRSTAVAITTVVSLPQRADTTADTAGTVAAPGKAAASTIGLDPAAVVKTFAEIMREKRRQGAPGSMVGSQVAAEAAQTPASSSPASSSIDPSMADATATSTAATGGSSVRLSAAQPRTCPSATATTTTSKVGLAKQTPRAPTKAASASAASGATSEAVRGGASPANTLTVTLPATPKDAPVSAQVQTQVAHGSVQMRQSAQAPARQQSQARATNPSVSDTATKPHKSNTVAALPVTKGSMRALPPSATASSAPAAATAETEKPPASASVPAPSANTKLLNTATSTSRVDAPTAVDLVNTTGDTSSGSLLKRTATPLATKLAPKAAAPPASSASLKALATPAAPASASASAPPARAPAPASASASAPLPAPALALVPPDDAKLELTDAEKARFLLEEIRREATHAMTHTAVIDEDDLQRELDALSDTGGDVSGSDDNDIDLDKELDELMRMAAS